MKIEFCLIVVCMIAFMFIPASAEIVNLKNFTFMFSLPQPHLTDANVTEIETFNGSIYFSTWVLPKGDNSMDWPSYYIYLGQMDTNKILYFEEPVSNFHSTFHLIGYSYEKSREGYEIVSELDLMHSLDFFKRVMIYVKNETKPGRWNLIAWMT